MSPESKLPSQKMITNGAGWTRWLSGIVMGVLGGVSSAMGLSEAGLLRPDPFTSRDAEKMQDALIDRISLLQQDNRDLRDGYTIIIAQINDLRIEIAKLPAGEELRQRLRDLERGSHDHDFEQ